MMIQSASAGDRRFVCTMEEHNDLCDQFAQAFGNAEFERPHPHDEVLYAIRHHDQGWEEFDANPVLDTKSGFPAGLGTGPVPGGLDTNRRSPDFNEARHAYCGLLSSMHSWGLYNGRYGFTEFRVRKGGATSIPVPPDQADAIHAMLDGERTRQQRLKAELAADPETAAWVEEKRLMQNYKLLQFCDTLALYFNLRNEAEREEEVFVHVPKSPEADATVPMRPTGGNHYLLTPFPFAGDRLETRCRGRYFDRLNPDQQPDDLAALLYGQTPAEQIYVFVAN